MQLDGKIALVTGGSSGIGLAAAQRLAAEGAQVIVTARDGERLGAAGALLGDRGQAIAADLAEPPGIARLMAKVRADYGRLDVLVANAGVSNAPPIAQLDLAAYESLMAVNCRGATFVFVEALPVLSDGASVVFVGSVASRKGQPGDALYAGSKGFIRAFARTAGTDPDLLRRHIRVNVVTPGPIDTPLTQVHTTDPAIRAYKDGLVPMGRIGHPGEVANAILFLASEQSSFTTGAEITVDGGFAHA